VDDHRAGNVQHPDRVALCRSTIGRSGLLSALLTALLAALPECTLALLLPSIATAQAWPDRPIRVIVSVPAGGTPDVIARLVTAPMAAQLGQPSIIDNRGGAGGLIGVEVAAKAIPDGYTLFLSSPGPMAILPHLQKLPTYDPIVDFAPIGLISAARFC